MKISLKANVKCSDGLCGRTTCVFIAPLTRQLSHIVVAEQGFPYLKRLVPLELIMTATASEVYLKATGSQLTTLKPILEIEQPWEGGLYFTYPVDRYRTWPNGSSEAMPIPAGLETTSPEQLPIHQDSPVRAVDGRVGRVKEFLVNPANKRITHVTIQRGMWWWQSELTIPVAHIDHFAKDMIFLKTHKSCLQNLAAIRSLT